jgi:hypothetical protein
VQQGQAARGGFVQYAEQGDEVRHGDGADQRAMDGRFHGRSSGAALVILSQRALPYKAYQTGWPEKRSK